MKKLLICYIVFFLSFNSNGLTLKTVAQDNSTVKYNLQDTAFPGFCREIITLVENEIPELKFTGLDRAVPIQRIEQFLQRNEIDIFFCLLKTKEREAKFNYIDIPLYSVSNVLLVKTSDPLAQKKVIKLSDLKNEGVILVNKGSALVESLKLAGVKYSDGGKGDLQIIELLEANRGRFFYGQDATLRFMLKTHAKKDHFKVIPIAEEANAQYVVYSKKLDPKVVVQIKSVIQKLSENGTFTKMYQKYSRKKDLVQKWSLAIK